MSLKLRGYGVAFGTRVILSEVHADIGLDGELEILMGPVGVGKSTLLRSLAGLHENNPDWKTWGAAEMDGQPISGRHKPILMTQKKRTLGGTVSEAIESALRERLDSEMLSAREWKDRVLAEIEQWETSSILPASDLAKPVLELPSFSQKIVCILAHLALRPAWLLLDEPNYGLEEREAERLAEWLKCIAGRVRMLVCLHHQGLASRIAGRILLLGGGRVLAHERQASFFGVSSNPWVQEFRRTGSLSIPSPNARAEDLAEGVPAPPPLPAAALRALAMSKKQMGYEHAREDAPPTQRLDDTRPNVRSSRPPDALMSPPAGYDEASRAYGTRNSSSAPAPAESSNRRFDAEHRFTRAQPSDRVTQFELPRLSDQGVELGAMVGNVFASDHRGPIGFRWIIPGQLAGCAEPGALAPIRYDLELLRNVGVTWLLTLTENDLDTEALARAGLRNLHIPIIDREAPTTRQAYMLTYRLQKLLDQGEVVAVHCKAGIGRTGTVLAAWLIREGGLTAKEAIDRLRRIHPAYVQSEEQEAFLHAFENDILMRS